MVVLLLERKALTIAAVLGVFVRRKGMQGLLGCASEKEEQRQAAGSYAVKKRRGHGDNRRLQI